MGPKPGTQHIFTIKLLANKWIFKALGLKFEI